MRHIFNDEYIDNLLTEIENSSTFINNQIKEAYSLHKNSKNVYQKMKYDQRYGISFRNMTPKQLKLKVKTLKQKGIIRKHKRNEWTRNQTKAVQAGYALFRGRHNVFAPIKTHFNEYLENKSISEIREKVNNLKRQGVITKTKDL